MKQTLISSAVIIATSAVRLEAEFYPIWELPGDLLKLTDIGGLVNQIPGIPEIPVVSPAFKALDEGTKASLNGLKVAGIETGNAFKWLWDETEEDIECFFGINDK